VAPRHTTIRGDTTAISAFEPRAARLDVLGTVALVDPPLAPFLPAEVFDGVGHVDVVAPDPGGGEGLVEEAPGGTDERLALTLPDGGPPPT